jgi:hypothetical protein
MLKEIKKLRTEQKAAVRAKKLEMLEEGLDIVLPPLQQWPETSKACCEELVHKAKVFMCEYVQCRSVGFVYIYFVYLEIFTTSSKGMYCTHRYLLALLSQTSESRALVPAMASVACSCVQRSLHQAHTTNAE